MASSEDIVLRIRGEDNASSVFSRISQTAQGMGIVGYSAVQAVSQKMLSFAQECVSSAMSAETAWIAFGNALNNVGGDFDNNSASIKKQIRALADEAGRSTADVRASMTALMNKGFSFEQAIQGHYAAAGIAASGLADTEESASNMIIQAMNGRGLALKKLGLYIDDYKDSASGQIDIDRLLQDIIAKTGQAQSKYADSTASDVQRVNNALRALKTDFGNAILSSIKPIIPVAQALVQGFSGLPGPIKSCAFAIGALGAGIGILSGPVLNAVQMFKALNDALGLTTLLSKSVALTESLLAGVQTLLSGEIGTLNGFLTTKIGLLIADNDALLANAACEEVATLAAYGMEASFGTLISTIPAFIGEILSTTVAIDIFGISLAISVGWLLAIVIAVIAVVVAFEKIGEYFGWWDDFGSMLEAITAGVNRLWSAFMNSPQVQGTIQDITNALNWLLDVLSPVTSAITWAWNAIFNPSGGEGTWDDPVGSIINAFGRLGNLCGDIVNKIKSVGSAIMSLPGAIVKFVTVLAQLPIKIAMIYIKIYTTIFTYIGKIASYVVKGALKIVIGFINGIKSLPSRVTGIIGQIPGIILGIIGSAVGAAISLCSSIISAVASGITGVATTVYNEFIQIGSKIQQAVSSAVTAATNFGTDIKNAVLDALSINSPGIIQRTVQWEFAEIPARISESNYAVRNAARLYATNLKDGFGIEKRKLSSNNLINATKTGMNGLNNNNNVINLYVQDGAFKFDAHNLTTKECKQIAINAFEGLNSIEYIKTNNNIG